MKTYELKETKDPDIFRVVDREGNWENYFVKSLNAYLRGVTTILNGGYAKGAFFDQWLSQHTADERDAILKAAGEKGDKVHRAIDLILSAKGKFALDATTGILNRETGDHEPLSAQEWDCMLAFESFWGAHAPVVLVSEATLYNLGSGYAGTADAILILTKACGVKACRCEELVGQVGLYDWKTSGGIRASYSAQVAAYANASNIVQYLPLGYKAPDYTAVLRLGTNHKTTGGYEFKAWDREATGEAFVRFCGARNIYEAEHKPFDPATDIQEIPDEVKFDVPHYDFTKPKIKVETKPEKQNGKNTRSDDQAGRGAKVGPRKAGNSPRRKGQKRKS